MKTKRIHSHPATYLCDEKVGNEFIAGQIGNVEVGSYHGALSKFCQETLYIIHRFEHGDLVDIVTGWKRRYLVSGIATIKSTKGLYPSAGHLVQRAGNAIHMTDSEARQKVFL